MAHSSTDTAAAQTLADEMASWKYPKQPKGADDCLHQCAFSEFERDLLVRFIRAPAQPPSMRVVLEKLSACVFEAGLTADNTDAWLEAKRILAAPQPLDPAYAELTPEMLDAGAQALANDEWPNPPASPMPEVLTSKYRRQALLVLKAALALSSTQGKCICQDQHRRGYCTEPGCPYAISSTHHQDAAK